MWRFLVGFFVLLIISCSFVHSNLNPNKGPKVPCHFIFGDSLFDAGNNNDLITEAKSNYPPYGIDFPGGVATGRFTNGLTTADVLTKILGFQELIQPFSIASGDVILNGVNYASGSAGLRQESGSHLGDRIWLARQVRNHEKTIEELKTLVEEPVSEYLNKCLYSINTGSNDYINNYFMPNLYPSSNVSTPDEFASELVAEYKNQLQALYDLGARRTAIFGLGLIGCIPAELEINNKIFLCEDEINEAAKLFNKKLVNLIDFWNENLPDAKFTFIDIMTMQGSSRLIPGIKKASPCCKLRTSDYQCEASSKPCNIRTFYSFFDGFHPTQMLNVLSAQTAFFSPLHVFVHPVNINTLLST